MTHVEKLMLGTAVLFFALAAFFAFDGTKPGIDRTQQLRAEAVLNL